MSDWIEINIPYYKGGVDNFTMRGLNKPGVLIRMEDDSEFLIGHINEVGGICKCCMDFSNGTIVKAYKVVWQEEHKP